MFRRLFWLVVGIAIGAWGNEKVNRARRKLTPEGIAETAAERVGELGEKLRRFTEDMRAGMAEREAEPRGRRVPGPRRDDAHHVGNGHHRKDER